MADEVRRLTTQLKVTGVDQFKGGMLQASGAAETAGGVFSKLTQLMAPLTAAFAGVSAATAVRELINISEQYEDTTRSIAASFGALGVTKDFNTGLVAASKTLDKITVAAAKLPGEADDYITVFKNSLPVVQAAVGGTADDMVKFTNQYTAITSSLRVEAGQAAADLNRMLNANRGMANAINPTFRALLPYITAMTKGTKQQVTNAGEFNKLSLKERTDLLNRVMNQGAMNDMLKDAAGSWGAQVGALASMNKMLLRLGGAPLFDAMKRWLGDFNALFMDGEGNLTAFARQIVGVGNLLSKYVVGAIDEAVKSVHKLAGHFTLIGNIIKKSGLAGAIKRGAPSLGGGAMAVAGAATAGVLGPLTPIFALLAGGLTNFLSRAGALESILSALEGTFSILAPFIAQATNMFAVFSALIGDALEGTVIPLFNAFNEILKPVLWIQQAFWAVGFTILHKLQPTLKKMWEAVGHLVKSLGHALAPIIKIVGIALVWLYQKLSAYLIPKVQMVIKVFTFLIDALAKLLNWLGDKLNDASIKFQEAALGPDVTPEEDDFLKDLLKTFDDLGKEDKADEAADTGPSVPGARGGAKVTQDFRNSRFTINQKFAEGFDPDRVGVALTSDVGRAAAQRLQSGFEPLYGVR